MATGHILFTLFGVTYILIFNTLALPLSERFGDPRTMGIDQNNVASPALLNHRGCDPRDERCGSGCMDPEGTCCGGGFFCYLEETCKYSDDSSKVECCVSGSCTAANLVRLSGLGAPIITRTDSPSAAEDSLSTAVQAGESEIGGTTTFPGTTTRVQEPESTIKSIEMFARDGKASCSFCVCRSSNSDSSYSDSSYSDSSYGIICPPGCCKK